MPHSNVLIVAVDGLRASALGAYGNTSYSTPTLDQFAAESLLLDACFAPSADLATIYRGLWQAAHPLSHELHSSDTSSLPQEFSERGYQSTLIADEGAVLQLAAAAGFEHVIETSPSLTSLFAEASDELGRTAEATGERPHLVWVHSRGMYGPWDAPVELQESLLDEGDPPPVEAGDSPDLILSPKDDPDTAFRYGCAYAAQVMLLDDCWKGLLSVIDENQADGEWLVVLIGVRGFPLGEHARIGGIDARLYGEQLHVPWLWRFPDRRGQLLRRGELTTHSDLLPTLYAWLPADEASDAVSGGKDDPLAGRSLLPLIDQPSPSWREALLSSSSEVKSYRTTGWTLRQNAEAELYVRPDDRYEANDVAARCPDIVAEMEQAILEIVGQNAAASDTVGR